MSSLETSPRCMYLETSPRCMSLETSPRCMPLETSPRCMPLETNPRCTELGKRLKRGERNMVSSPLFAPSTSLFLSHCVSVCVCACMRVHACSSLVQYFDLRLKIDFHDSFPAKVFVFIIYIMVLFCLTNLLAEFTFYYSSCPISMLGFHTTTLLRP